jgi:hypothetical protein
MVAYDGSSGGNFVVLQIQIFDRLWLRQRNADQFGTWSSKSISLKIQTLDVWALLDILGEDLHPHIRNLIERKINMPNQLW